MHRLLDLRRREEAGDRQLSQLRRVYRERTATFVKRLSETQKLSDWNQIQHEYRTAMEDDLADLKTELNIAVEKTLLSKDVLTSVVIGAGIYTAALMGVPPIGLTLAGVAGGVGTLIKAGTELFEARRKAFANRPMSWLYQAQ
jgi:hypothetical protein